jgi:non-canonical purine NTP pyrophosphatase (RdgB/HAM1 family)
MAGLDALSLGARQPLTRRALVAGGGAAGMTAALALARLGIPVHLVERDLQLGGQWRQIRYQPEALLEPDAPDPQQELQDLIDQVQAHPLIEVHTNTKVTALEGRPGVYSARYSGPDATDESNIDRLLQELRGVPDERRTAAFHCCAVYVSPDDSTSLVAEGRWQGKILERRRGTAGFGYDPVFFDPECGRTAAELGPELKNACSHRGKALTALADMLRQHYA